jgi:methylmalonyl-CoA/ethylmalonyl-CoA epimerase
MIERIAHIGIVVKDIEESLAAFTKALSIPMSSVKDIPARKLKVSMVMIGGIGMEFLEDYSEDGLLAKLVKERGNCIHHFCLHTEQIEADLDILRSRGVGTASQKPAIGVRGKKTVFIKPNIVEGIPLELSET